MILLKLTHASTIVSRGNRQRIIDALPATQKELQENLHLSRPCVSSHISALKKDKAIYISAYEKPVSRGVGAGPYIETYSLGNKKDISRPDLYNDTEWQRRKRAHMRKNGEMEDYNKKQRDSRFLNRAVPKLDPLAVMYARNESENISGTSSNQ